MPSHPAAACEQGVEDATSTVGGMIKAGSSTSIGFMGVQMAENVVLPAGKNWVD